MNRSILVVTVLLLLCVGLTTAQVRYGGIARQAAMGGSQGGSNLILNPFIMNDPALMLINPAYQVMYRDYAWSNIAGGRIVGTPTTVQDGYGSQNAGIAFMLNDQFNLGAILSYDPSAVNLVTTLPSQFGGFAQTVPSVANVWELIASTHLASMDLGFGLMYGSSNRTNKSSTTTPTSTEVEGSARMFGFRGGLVFDLGSGNSIDGSATLRMDKATEKRTASPTTAGPTGEYSASGTEIQFGARAKFKVSNKFNFVPYGVLALLSAEPKQDTPPAGATATTASSKFSATAYGIGVGGEYRSNSLYLAGGVSWQSGSVKNETTPNSTTPVTTYTASYSALPVVNVGGEWWFTDWLAGRTGYFRYIGSETYKIESSTGTVENSSTAFASFPPGFPAFAAFPFPGVHSFATAGSLAGNWDGVVTMGVGFKFGGWTLDATVADEVLRRGLGLIGSSDNINTFGYLTASYDFAE